MLNCCIERKKARDEGKKTSPSDNVTNAYSGDAGKAGGQLGLDHLRDTEKEKGEVGKSWDSWSDSEEEFFECLSDTEDLKGNGQESGKKGGPKEMASLKPEGRLHQHGRLTLLHNGEPLYIPVTQVCTPRLCVFLVGDESLFRSGIEVDCGTFRSVTLKVSGVLKFQWILFTLCKVIPLT